MGRRLPAHALPLLLALLACAFVFLLLIAQGTAA
jgi:hypothetical protein